VPRATCHSATRFLCLFWLAVRYVLVLSELVRLLQIYIVFVSLATCCTVHFAGILNNRLLLIRVRRRPRCWSFPNCYVWKPELYRKLRNKEILNILIKNDDYYGNVLEYRKKYGSLVARGYQSPSVAKTIWDVYKLDHFISLYSFLPLRSLTRLTSLESQYILLMK
jgi:hypothetical protein